MLTFPVASLTPDKVYGFLEVVAKTGRAETNSGSGAARIQHRPWEEVHRSLGEAMKERRAPYADVTAEPHETRGTFEECQFKACVIGRENIDNDPLRRTAKVTIDLSNTGITFAPGDRLSIMPANSTCEMDKVVRACGLSKYLDFSVPLEGLWQRYAKHVKAVYNKVDDSLTARDILRWGKLSPLGKDVLMKVLPAKYFSNTD